MDASDSGTPSVDRVFLLLSYGFPSAAMVCICNAGVSDTVFSLAGFVGRRALPILLRRLFASVFASVAAALGVFASLWVLRSCRVDADFCSSAGHFGEPSCTRASVLSLVMVLLCMLVDRVWLPFVGLKTARPRRAVDSFGVAVAWLFLSERDPVAALAIVVLNVGRVRFLRTKAGLWLGRAARLGLLSTCLLAMAGRCRGVSAKNAAGGALLSLLA